ncbi:MAG TPA: S41 family peptidase [Rudaea sp.]|jgi:carboxyl-terminal processing protease|uniref:S41 family peptidase n=1 Tax=Rudaea sp. TaxID=2136325 RepID=UPI002F955888
MILLFLVAALATPLVSAADFRESDRDHAYTMLRDVRLEIEQKYFDPAFKGIDMAANAEVAKTRIAKATSIGEAFAAIAQFVLELDDSHTFFVPPWQTTVVDYGWSMEMVGETCYVVRVKPGSDAARQGVTRGDAVKTVNGYRPTRESFWRLEYLFRMLRPQPGLHVELATSKGAARELDLAAEVRQRKRVVALTGADSSWDIARINDERAKESREQQPVTVEVGKQVLFVRLPTFAIDESAIRQILHRAHGYETLILDLRGNRGGPVVALQALLGGLSAKDVAIGSLKERGHTTPLLAKGVGKDAFAGRVFVLVDAESASASELFARTVQLIERGTVIGDRTAGAVMTAQYNPLLVSHGENVIVYGALVTTADVIMSDGGRLEKKGVTPDFIVLPTAEDLAAGRDPALAQAFKFAGQSLDAAAAGALLPKE